jgi:hypothetical protein
LRFFFRRHIPHFHRVLLVESGSRHLLERFLAQQCQGATVDLITCYSGAPTGFTGPTFRVQDYPTGESKQKLLAELVANRYDVIGIICSGEPIMTKWKWWLGFRVPAKLFLLNENGDWFWFDYLNWRTIWQFASYRAGLAGSGLITTPLRILLFPLTLTYLLLFALKIHTMKYLRTRI